MSGRTIKILLPASKPVNITLQQARAAVKAMAKAKALRERDG